MARVLTGAGALSALVLVIALAWRTPPGSSAADIAAGLEGERWYAVTFGDTPIGHYHTTNGRTEVGDFQFRSVLHFQLSGELETRTEARLVFRRDAPHPLIRAEQATATNGVTLSRVTIADGVAQVVDDASRQAVAMDDTLSLADYLALEGWLATASPGPGNVRSSRSVDFDRLAVVTDQWRVKADDDAGIAVAKDSAQDSTRVYLDADLVPARMEVGEHLALQRVADEHSARGWQRHAPLLVDAARHVPVDRAIADPTMLRRLVVAVDRIADGDDAKPALLLAAEADPRTPARAEELARASAATVRFPAADPELRELADRAVAGLVDGVDKANSLTLFVHNHLRYRDAQGPRTVHDTVRDRRGDCTEFADLYTTLARAAGLPARTVVGLAYQRETKAFALHAWNEVAINAVWRGVDPTWGQTRLDATHLALPADAPLATIARLSDMRLRVVEALY